MSDPSSEKICFFCGQSCAGQPRGKDPRGRYYHKACLEAKHVDAAEPGGVAASDDVDLLEGLLEAAPATPPAVAGGTSCPNCGQPLGGAAVCMSCGFNTVSGKALKSKVHRVRNVGGPSTEVGRLVIGIISIVWGGFQTVSTLVNGMAVFSQGANIIALAVTGLFLGLALMLLFGGIGVTRRRQTGYAMLKRWGVIQLVLGLLCVGGPTLLLLAMSGNEDMPEEIKLYGPAVMFIALAIVVAWPIAVLIWGANTDASDWD